MADQLEICQAFKFEWLQSEVGEYVRAMILDEFGLLKMRENFEGTLKRKASAESCNLTQVSQAGGQ